MRVRVIEDICQGHTQCAMSAPVVFGLREEDGHAYLLITDIPAEHEDAVRRAALGCPEQAIQID